MGVRSLHFTQYYVRCDSCGLEDTVVNSAGESVYSKQQAIKWADMHKVKDGRILCDKCFNQYKVSIKKGE